MAKQIDKAINEAAKNPWMRVHIVRCGDQYFLAIRRRDGSNALVYMKDGSWRNPVEPGVNPHLIIIFNTEDDARDVAEAIVHVPGEYRSVLDVLGPEEERWPGVRKVPKS